MKIEGDLTEGGARSNQCCSIAWKPRIQYLSNLDYSYYFIR